MTHDAYRIIISLILIGGGITLFLDRRNLVAYDMDFLKLLPKIYTAHVRSPFRDPKVDKIRYTAIALICVGLGLFVLIHGI